MIEEPSTSPTDSATSRRAWPLFALLAGAMVVLVMATQSWYGMSWDEAYYYPAYEEALAWTRLAVSAPGTALGDEAIRAGWMRVEETPPVTRWIGATGIALGHVLPRGWELAAVRVPQALLFGVTLWVLMVMAARRGGAAGGVVAGVAYGLHPHVFGHAHMAATETVFAFLTLIALWLSDSPWRGWRAGVAWGVLLGLMFATKVNAVIVAVALVCCLVGYHGVRHGAARQRRLVDDGVMLGVAIVLAPVVALAVWPWMWHDTPARVWGYVEFVKTHFHQGVWYMGRRWNFPPPDAPMAPWHYPVVMLVLSSPLAWLVVVIAALSEMARELWRRRAAIEPVDLMALLLVVGPLMASLLPGTPKYDGVRLFFPVFVAFAYLVGRAVEWLPASVSTPRRGWLIACPLLVLWLVDVAPVVRSSKLGYYNAAVRALAPRGVLEFPFEVSYWGEGLTQPVLDEMDAALPPGQLNIKTLAFFPDMFTVQQRLGRISSRFTFDGDPPYDAHIIQHRRGFWGRAETSIVTHREPIAVWPADAPEPRVLLYDGRPPGADAPDE